MTDLLSSENYPGLMMTDFRSIEFLENHLRFISQTKLPLAEIYIKTDDYNRVAEAIEVLEIRGAPAIGIAAAYAVYLGVSKLNEIDEDEFEKIIRRLASTRPTAVNLFWALDRMKTVFSKFKDSSNLKLELLNQAKSIHNEDIEMCRQIGEHGLEIFKNKSTVLTHCNTGKLATGGDGTAFSIILNGFKNNLVEYVYADETRPLLQGSRLTAFELAKAGIPFSINPDSSAAVLLKENRIDCAIVGSDRIALNGDAANKIGTYNLAVLCKYHGVPFYIAAPTSTIDKNCASGKDITIEFRGKDELNSIRDQLITSPEYDAFNPAFDVTPHELITGIVTEKALHKPPYNFANI